MADNSTESVLLATAEKARGNELTKKGEWEEALKIYSSAITLLESEEKTTTKTTEDKDKQLWYSLMSNRSLCELKLRKFKECIQTCESARKLFPDVNKNAQKLYLRESTAHCELQQWDAALVACAKLMEIDRKDKESLSILSRAREGAIKAKDAASKSMTPDLLTARIEEGLIKLRTEVQSQKVEEDAVSSVTENLKKLSEWLVINSKRLVVINSNNCLKNLFEIYQLILSVQNKTNAKVEDITELMNLEEETLKPASDSTLGFEFNESKLVFLLSFWRFLTILTASSSAHDFDDQDLTVDVEKRAVKQLSTTIKVADDVSSARSSINKLLSMPFLQDSTAKLIQAGVSDRSEVEKDKDGDHSQQTNLKRLRGSVVTQMFQTISSVGSIFDSSCLFLLASGIDCMSNSQLGHAPLHALGVLCDRARRQGRSAKALTLSPGLEKCVHSLLKLARSKTANMKSTHVVLASDMAPTAVKVGDLQRHIEFSLLCIFVLLADKDRSANENVDWQKFLTNILTPVLFDSSDSNDMSVGLQCLNILWMADRSIVQEYMLSTNLVPVLLSLMLMPSLSRTQTPSSSLSPSLPEVSSHDIQCCISASELLVSALEFPEIRALIITQGGIERLAQVSRNQKDEDLSNSVNINAIDSVTLKTLQLTALARLAMQDEETKELVFELVDFFSMTEIMFIQLKTTTSASSTSLNVVNNKSQQTSPADKKYTMMAKRLLNVLFFFSVHSSVKRRILNLPEPPADKLLSTGPEGETPSGDAQCKKPKQQSENLLNFTEEELVRLSELMDSFAKGGKVIESSFMDGLSDLAEVVSKVGDLESRFLLAGVMHNLTRSAKDRDKMKQGKNMPQFDAEQMRQLDTLYDNLPEEAKPQLESGKYDRGSPELTDCVKFCIVKNFGKLISCISNIATASHPVATPNLVKLCCEPVKKCCQQQALRSSVFKLGGLKLAMKGIEILQNESPDDVRELRQLICHFAISIDPKMLTYSEKLNMASEMCYFLEDDSELFSYEACMGLTNLSSDSEETRVKIFNTADSWSKIRDLMTSENDLLRAAAVEMLCNMSLSSEIQDKLVALNNKNNQLSFDLQFLLALTLECNNERAETAAAGCLVHLSSDIMLCLAIAKQRNFKSLITSVNEAVKNKHIGTLVRSTVALVNIWNALDAVAADMVHHATRPESKDEVTMSETVLGLNPSYFLVPKIRSSVDSSESDDMDEFSTRRRELFVGIGMVWTLNHPEVQKRLVSQITMIDRSEIKRLINQCEKNGVMGQWLQFWADALNRSESQSAAAE